MTYEIEYTGGPASLQARTRADVEIRFLVDGKASTPTGTLTYSVADAEGDVIATGTPTTAGVGHLTAPIPASTIADPTVLTVTWAGLVFSGDPAISVTTEHQVIAGLLFTLAEAREFERPAAPLAQENAYPDAVILAARERIAGRFSEILGYGIGARWREEFVSGDGTREIWLAPMACKSIVSIATRDYSTRTYTTFTADELEECFLRENGRLVREGEVWPDGSDNIRVRYIAGVNPVPLELKRAGLLVLKNELLPSSISDRVISQTNEQGNLTYSVPGRAGAFYGIPEVDQILRERSRKIPAMA